MGTSLWDLSGKVAIVTGATRGLGRAMADALAGAGANIVVTSRSPADCEKVAAEIERLGVRALPVPGDVSKKENIERLVGRTLEEFGTIDILVNNAGTAVTKSALDITEEDWDQVLNVNLKAVFFLAQAVGREMVKRGKGKIINIASMLGLVGDVAVLPYCVSKGGVLQMTRALALEWARYGVTVNAVAPGYVITSMNEAAFQNPKVMEHVLRKTPLRRLGQAEEVAGAVVYLASDAANYTTGSVLVVDGGWTAE